MYWLLQLDLFELVKRLWDALQVFGSTLLELAIGILDFFHISVPEFVIQLATAFVFLLVILKFGKHLGKIILIIVLLFIATTLWHGVFSTFF